MPERLSPAQETLLLATRCFGRATPFPHRLMETLLAQLDDTPYKQLVADLRKQKLIKKEGKVAFTLTSDGLHARGFLPSPVPASIWDAALTVIKDVVIQTIAHKELESLDLLTIHTAALANAFYSVAPRLYLEVMGICVFCLEQLGRHDDAEVRMRQIQRVLDSLHAGDD